MVTKQMSMMLPIHLIKINYTNTVDKIIYVYISAPSQKYSEHFPPNWPAACCSKVGTCDFMLPSDPASTNEKWERFIHEHSGSEYWKSFSWHIKSQKTIIWPSPIKSCQAKNPPGKLTYTFLDVPMENCVFLHNMLVYKCGNCARFKSRASSLFETFEMSPQKAHELQWGVPLSNHNARS